MIMKEPNPRTSIFEHLFFRIMKVSGWVFLLGVVFQSLATGGIGDRSYDLAFFAMMLYLISVILSRYGW
jgi:hypothetical protein